jgi:single-strand DNA-binding protein
MINKVILLGNLGKDPETRTLDNGNKVTNFSLATSEVYNNQKGEKVKETEWHNISFFGGLAEICEKYLTKGSQIYIEGKIQTRSYEQDGVTKYATNILGYSLKMLGKAAPEQGQQQEEKVDSGNDLPF